MKVRCCHRANDIIPLDLCNVGYTPESQINVKYNEEFCVYTLLFSRGILNYLIINDDTLWRPNLIPACFFRIIDAKIPASWRCGFWRQDESPRDIAVCGYEEITTNEGRHLYELIEREPEALAIFDRRRREIDEEMSGMS